MTTTGGSHSHPQSDPQSDPQTHLDTDPVNDPDREPDSGTGESEDRESGDAGPTGTDTDT